MASNDLFVNPTTGVSEFGDKGLSTTQRAFKSLGDEAQSQTDTLKSVINQFTTRKPVSSPVIDFTDLKTKYGVTDYKDSPGADGGMEGFLNASKTAAEQGYSDVYFGASLLKNDSEVNILAAEQKYQRTLGETPTRLGYNPDSWTRFMDSDWLGNLAGGTLPSLSGMAAGGATGIPAGPIGM